MSDFPSDWETKTVGEVCRLQNGRAFKPTDWSRSGLPIVRIQNLNNADAPFNHFDGEVEPRHIIDSGQLLFAWSGTPGTSFGAHIWNGGRAVLNQHIFKVEIDEAALDKRFVRFALNQRLSTFIEKAHGGVGLGHITKGKFEGTELGIPPLDVQRRIVAKLDELLVLTRAAREQLEAVPALVEQYRQSVLAAAFRGDLTADWRKKNPDVEPASKLLERIRIERRQKWEAAELAKLKAKGKSPKDDKWKSKYVEPEPVDTSDLPDLPPSWAWTSLESITHEADGIVDGPFGSHLKSADYVSDGPVVVRLGNLGVGVFKDGDLARVPREKFDQLIRHEVVAGDLIVSALAEPVGRCCEAPAALGKAIVKADCVRVRPVAAISRNFVMWSLNSPGSLARAAGAGHGLGRVRMNLSDIRARAVPLAPAAEQAELMRGLRSTLDGANGGKMVAFDLLLNVDSFERALLAKAFRGELVT